MISRKISVLASKWAVNLIAWKYCRKLKSKDLAKQLRNFRLIKGI